MDDKLTISTFQLFQMFPDQESAEEWMGDSWADLRERGVEEVILMDDERNERVYRMALSES